MKSSLDLPLCLAPPSHCLHQMNQTETFLSLQTGCISTMLIMVIGPDHDDDDHYCFDYDHDHEVDNPDDDHDGQCLSFMTLCDKHLS